MTTQTKTSKGQIDPLNRYGIADAAKTRITAQIFCNVIKPRPKQPETTAVLTTFKAQNQIKK